MDIVDFVIVLLIVLGGWNGYRTGFVRQVTRLLGVFIAYFVALWLRPRIVPVIAPLLGSAHWSPAAKSPFVYLLGDLSGAISFALIFLVAFVVLRWCAGLIDALFSLPVLSSINRAAGLITGLVLAVVFVYVSSLVAHYINSPGLQLQMNHSLILQWLDAKRSSIVL